MKRKQIVIIVLSAIGLVAATATASALVMNHSKTVKTETAEPSKITQKEEIHWKEASPAPAQQQTANCDDENVVGAVAGGVGGGILGSNIGSGSGKTAATIGGTLGGAYLGKELLPTQNVTCR